MVINILLCKGYVRVKKTGNTTSVTSLDPGGITSFIVAFVKSGAALFRNPHTTVCIPIVLRYITDSNTQRPTGNYLSPYMLEVYSCAHHSKLRGSFLADIMEEEEFANPRGAVALAGYAVGGCFSLWIDSDSRYIITSFN